MAKSFERLIGDYDSGAHRRFIADLAARPGSPLTYLQKMRLDELADLLETLNLNDSSSWVGNRRASRYGEVVDLIGVLGGFDTAVIAGQAQVVLDRMDHDDDHAPFFALFDGAQACQLDRWDLVADRAAAVDLLLDMLTWGLGNAQVAAGALWGKEVADLAAQRLRVMVPKLAEHTEHQRLAAHVLASMVDRPEPRSWLDSDDPILRAVAAMWCDATSGEGISPYLLRLLEDPDGYVRSAAVRRLSDITGAERDDALKRVARDPDPGWTCLSCRTVNEPGRSVCAKPECHRAPPHPADEAQKILARPKGASP